MHRRAIGLLILALSLCAGGCMQTVQPWQRDALSRPAMQLIHPFDTRFDEHIYFSREASSGGRGFAAGGCGCN